MLRPITRSRIVFFSLWIVSFEAALSIGKGIRKSGGFNSLLSDNAHKEALGEVEKVELSPSNATYYIRRRPCSPGPHTDLVA